MGFNISGVVIDQNYKNNLSELESILGEKLIFDKEVTFEEASENWKGYNYCDIYFSEEGTLVFLSMEKGGFEFYAKKQKAFSFVLSEMIMMFSVNYVENGFKIRSYLENESEIMENEGEPFEFELQQEDKSELIYHLIEETLGESFHNIELDEICLRYTFEPADELTIEKTDPVHEIRNDQVKKETKPWWKFW